MAIRIGINGFGRIGRMALRAAIKDFDSIEIVAINDLLDPEYLAYMFKYDSVHGSFNGDIEVKGQDLIVNGKKIRLTSEKAPELLDWKAVGVDVVLECTGIFLTQEACQRHISAGAKKVVLSAPGKDDTPMFVYGVNHIDYRDQPIVSASSCTSNALAPIVKVLHDNFGIKRGLMTTIHALTASQNTVDGPSKKDWRGGRGILENIIPASTGAAKSVGKLIPALKKKITGMAFRVPTSDVSVVDLTCELEKEATYDQILNVMRKAAQSPELRGVLGFTDEKVVSTDFKGSTHAVVFDAEAGVAIDTTFVKVVAWYDNEYGYTCNMLRLVEHIAN